MSLRKRASDELIKNLIGYDPENLCQDIIRRADAKWNQRKGIPSVIEAPINYRRKTNNILITWNTLWYNNLLYSKCKIHQTKNTPAHIKTHHLKSESLPNISDILTEGYDVHEKIKNNKSKRRGRLYKYVQQQIEKYEEIYAEILLL